MIFELYLANFKAALSISVPTKLYLTSKAFIIFSNFLKIEIIMQPLPVPASATQKTPFLLKLGE